MTIALMMIQRVDADAQSALLNLPA